MINVELEFKGNAQIKLRIPSLNQKLSDFCSASVYESSRLRVLSSQATIIRLSRNRAAWGIFQSRRTKEGGVGEVDASARREVSLFIQLLYQMCSGYKPSDVILFLVLGFCVYKTITFDKDEIKSELLRMWILVDIVLIIILRAFFMAIDQNQSRQKCYIMVLVAFVCPILTLWTIFGTVLFAFIEEKDRKQTGQENKWIDTDESGAIWIITFFLTISYFIILIYFITSIAICIDWVRVRRFDIMGTEFGNDNFEVEPRTSTLSGSELTLLEDKLLDKQEITEEESCSICFQEFKAGDTLKDLRICDHRFHKQCIEMWLQQNSTCPHCRKDVRDALLL